MKNSLLLFLIWVNINTYGQTMSVVSSEATPVSGGINVNLQTYCSEVMYSLEHNYTINGYQITLSSCYYITPLLTQTNLTENFFIPTPDTGNYVVNLIIYSSQSNITCDYSTIQATRNLTLSNDDFNIVDDDIKLSPNPTSGYFNIEDVDRSIDTIKFYNSFGQLVKVSKDLSNDISNFQNGIYYLVLQTKNGNISRKIALQK